ncbi:790_t:CDS:2 [Ambispora gerdemannii]|uniref:790_t:CDS:1 n=1 Tax=Ambispora gerdemannii TaxID=144530 RepID=A0A9N8VJE3_9GLOM|nr:790_t:CDS:2 [Ambispora gerdemannii]
MSIEKLSSDILQEIFSQFDKDPSKTRKHVVRERRDLHSCALVNRQWCEVAIPLLWRRTFFQLRESYSPIPPNPKLIDAYFYLEEWCLRRVQRRSRYEYPSSEDSSDDNLLDYDDDNSGFYNNKLVNVHNEQQFTKLSLKKRIKLLTPAVTRILLRIFMRNSTVINTLHCCGERVEHDEDYLIIAEPEFAEFFSSVRKEDIDFSFFHRRGRNKPIAPTSWYLSSYEVKNITTLIESQKNLKNLIIRYCEITDLVNHVMPSFKSQANTLRRLILHNVLERLHVFYYREFMLAKQKIIQPIKFWYNNRKIMPCSDVVPWLEVSFPELDQFQFIQHADFREQWHQWSFESLEKDEREDSESEESESEESESESNENESSASESNEMTTTRTSRY